MRALWYSLVVCAAALPARAEPQKLKATAFELNPYISAVRSEKGPVFDVVKRAFELSGYELEVEFLSPAEARDRVAHDKADLLLPSYGGAADSERFELSEPMQGTEVGNIERTSAAANSASIESVYVDSSVLGDEMATEALFVDEGGVAASSERVVQMVDLIASGKLRMAVADKLQVADVLVNRRANLIGKLRFVPPALSGKEFHVAVSKTNARGAVVLKAFNDGLAKLKKSGEYEAILLQYGANSREDPPEENTIRIGTVSNADMETLRGLSAHFLATHPGVKIEWFPIKENLIRRSILSGLALNEHTYDIVSIGNYDAALYAENDWIIPLNPPASYDAADLLPAIREALSYQGSLVALPFYGESSMLFYRKDLFEQAKLPGPPQTYAQVKEYAAKLHDPAHQVYGVCLRGLPGWGENMAFLSTLVNAYGGAWFDAKNRPSIDSKPWKEAVNYYVDLLSTYGPPSPEKNGYGENLKLFAEGHCGMWIDATVSMTSVLDPKTSKVASTVAFAPAPIVKPGRFGTHWVWTWSWAVPRSSKKQALAREFALWATSKDYIQLVAKEKGWLAVPPGTRYSTYASEGYQKALPSGAVVKREIETALDGAPVELGRPKTAAQFVMTPEFTAFGTSTGINVALALQKKLTVDEALKRSNDETRRVMTSEAKPNVRHAGTKKQKK